MRFRIRERFGFISDDIVPVWRSLVERFFEEFGDEGCGKREHENLFGARTHQHGLLLPVSNQPAINIPQS